MHSPWGGAKNKKPRSPRPSARKKRKGKKRRSGLEARTGKGTVKIQPEFLSFEEINRESGWESRGTGKNLQIPGGFRASLPVTESPLQGWVLHSGPALTELAGSTQALEEERTDWTKHWRLSGRRKANGDGGGEAGGGNWRIPEMGAKLKTGMWADHRPCPRLKVLMFEVKGRKDISENWSDSWEDCTRRGKEEETGHIWGTSEGPCLSRSKPGTLLQGTREV